MLTNGRRLPIYLTLFLVIFTLGQGFSAEVDTVAAHSAAMNKDIHIVVIRPDSYAKKKSDRYPVVYLLHGYGSNAASWLKGIPELPSYADKYEVILVCTDANIGSWYWDSPIDPAWKYETFTATELVNWVDGHYRTIAGRKGRGVTGFSMGGHGALYLSFRHQDVYGVAGCMSGGVDIRPFPNNWDMAKRLGTPAEHPENWERYTVTNMIDLLKPGSLALIIDCGTDDFFYDVNNAFHARLLAARIPHDYIVRPGKHDWAYWRNAIGYELLFMSNYFHANN